MDDQYTTERGDEPVAPEGFTIDTEAKAEWAAEILLSLEEQIGRRKAQLVRLEAQLERDRAFLLPLLAAYADAHPPRRGKTIRLANATLARRSVPGGLRIDDEDACREWARAHLPAALVPSFVENLDRAAVRAALEQARNAAYESAALAAPADASTEDVEAAAATAGRAALEGTGAVWRDEETRLYLKSPKGGAE